MPHPPGTIGIISGDLTRYGSFSQSLLSMAMPVGTTFVWIEGIWIAEACNTAIRAMQGDWIMLLADDHAWPSDMLLRLLDHQLPVVAPLCALRRPPFQPSLFTKLGETYHGYTWDDLEGKSGVLAVDAYGGPGVVLRREVIETIGEPWFECMPGKRTTPHEDLYFFSKCGERGFRPHVDLDLVIDHLFPGTLRPRRLPTGRYGVEVLQKHTSLGILTPQSQEVTDVATYHAHT